ASGRRGRVAGHGDRIVGGGGPQGAFVQDDPGSIHQLGRLRSGSPVPGSADAVMSELRAVYLIETPLDPARVAEILAGEQSSGTFVRVAGETDALRARSRATVA